MAGYRLKTLAQYILPGMVLVESATHRITVTDIEPQQYGCQKIHINRSLCYEPQGIVDLVVPMEVVLRALRNPQERALLVRASEGHESQSARALFYKASGD